MLIPPDLCQIQGNFLIRHAQAETAIEMVSPQSGENSVMQVNMGERKSSVIIPIVAAALADGKQLVRVIVPKPLTVQMFELLVARLGGLANRPIYHLPFSRSTHDYRGKVIGLQVDDLRKCMSQCIAERGIVLIQPEHAMSIKLMNVEEQIRQRKTDSFLNRQASCYKHVMSTLSLKLVRMDNYVTMIVASDSADNLTSVAGGQPCGWHVSMAGPIAQLPDNKAHRSG